MKIALCVPSSWPTGNAANGIVTYASQLVPALRQLGHEVFVLTPHKEDDDSYTIDLREFSSARNLWDRAMFRLAPERARFNAVSSSIASAVRELVDKRALDVFEMEESFGFSFAISRLKLIPVVVRLHGPWFLNGQFDDQCGDVKSNRQEWEGRGIRHAQLVTSPSAEVLRAVKVRYCLKLPESRTIPNPVRAVVREAAWDISTCETNSILFVGRFDKRKGGELALRAFAELAATYPELRLTFVGPDTGVMQEDGKVKHFAEYVRDCFPAEISARIDFKGQLDNSKVMSLRPKHFVTIIASQYEILPYSVLEAMSLGCPVIATGVGGIPELIRNGYNGFLVSSQNVEEMVLACRRLLNDHRIASRLGQQAWQDCLEFYGPENIARQTIAAYRKAIESFRGLDIV
jgi:glycosyltransferase involved in cell wall biosynthesis